MLFVYGRFKLKRWSKYNPEKRLKVLQALENKLARQNSRDALRVVVHENANWNCYGMFVARGEDKKIYVHENLLTNPMLRFHALETIIHEGRHAEQYEKVSKDELKWYEVKAKRWKENWQGYFSSSEDMTMYNNQEIERDAQQYTIKKLKRLARKYKNERDFAYTLQSNIDRYEKAEQSARKKYGIFHRFKINRRVRKKSQQNQY